MPLRSSEWVNLAAFLCLIALAWVLPGLNRKRRVKITTIGAAGAAITISGALFLPRWGDPSAGRGPRDWLPLLMGLPVFRPGGEFVTRGDVGFGGPVGVKGRQTRPCRVRGGGGPPAEPVQRCEPARGALPHRQLAPAMTPSPMTPLAILCALVTSACPALAGPEDALPRPSPVQAAWQDLELGMFIHIAPQTWQDSESDDLSTPLSAINPEKLSTDQWVDVAASMGARYLVFVAKHEGGFCWWQTETTDFSVKNTPWRGGKGDVLTDLSTSCRKRGVKLGVYLSPQDRKHGIGVGGRAADPKAQDGYVKLFRQQLTEVLTRYGDMMEVWFDGSLIFDVGDILAQHARNAVIFQGPQATIRWVGNEEGIAPDPAWNGAKFGLKRWGDYTAADGNPAGDRWLPNECDARIRSTWFWKTGNQGSLKTVPQLMDMYERSVGRGGVLLLNHTPDRTGLIPEADAKRSGEFGAEIRRRYELPTADTSGHGSELRLQPSAPVKVDRVMLMEDISQGERVRRYIIEGMVDGRWAELAAGTAVGHKRIDRLPPTTVAEVRVRVLEAVGEAQIRKFAIYGAGTP